MPTVTEIPEPQVSVMAVKAPVRVVGTRELLDVGPAYPQRTIFSDSLLDAGKQDKSRRRSATIISFVFQCFLLGVVLIVPLWFTDALPKQQLLTFLVAPPPPPPPPPPAAQAVAKVVRQIQSELLSTGQLRTPTRIPEKVQMLREEEAPPPLQAVGGVVGGVPGGIPGGQLGGVIGGIVSQSSNLAAVPKLAVPAAPKRVRMSQGVTKGMLLHKIEPQYPAIARQARVQGEVLLHAIISKDGSIKELEVVRGHPMLAPAAMAAVQLWRYRPFLLNGEPIEVETNVTVTFQLSQ